MPPLRLTTALTTALPPLSATSRAVVSALGCFNGATPPARELACLLGMRSRYQLARTLRQEGLPPLKELTGWARVLHWVLVAESTGASLHQLAHAAALDAATAYRLVRRVTGMRWSDLQRGGFAAAIRRFRDRCHIGQANEGSRAALDQRPGVLRVAPPLICQGAPARTRVLVATSRTPKWHPSPALTEREPVVGGPFDVAIGADGMAYVTCAHTATVERLTLDPLRAAGSMYTGAVPTRVVPSPDGAHAYVTNQFTEDIGVIDLERGRQTTTIRVPGHPMAAVLSLDGRTLFVTTNLDLLLAVSVLSGTVIASVPIPGMCTEIALGPTGSHLYVPTWRAGTILEVEARTLRTTRTFQVGGKVQGVAVTPDGASLFAANEDGWLDAIRLSRARNVARLNVGSLAFGVAISPDGAAVYVSLLRAGRVIVLDPGTLGVAATLCPGGNPRRIAFDADGRLALVANEAGWVDMVK